MNIEIHFWLNIQNIREKKYNSQNKQKQTVKVQVTKIEKNHSQTPKNVKQQQILVEIWNWRDKKSIELRCGGGGG